MSYNPYQATAGANDPKLNRQAAESKVKTPAILLMVSGIVSLLFNVVGGIMSAVLYLGMKDQMMIELRNQPQPPGQEVPEEMFEMIFNIYGYGGIVFAALGFIFGAFVVFASLRMLKLKGWGMAITASIVSIVPCFQGCCLLSLPVGIYALVVLMDSTVKSAFE